MEFLVLFFKGSVLGFSIAAPVGPIGLLCIRRTLTSGRMTGFISGAGAATADGVYGLLAAFGVAAALKTTAEYQFYFHLLGGLFLLYLGWHTYKSRVGTTAAKAESRGLVSAYATTFALTITNPMTIMSFAAIFAGVGMGTEQETGGAAFLVLGVFAGSLLWWLLLSTLVNYLKGGLTTQSMAWINKASGFLLVVFGLHSIFIA